MRIRHRIPTVFSLYMVDVLCCALGCVILLWQLKHSEAEEQSAQVLSITSEVESLQSALRESLKRQELLSIDLEKSGIKSGKNRKDDDYAVSWVKNYGKGLVFYCSLGHRNETFWNPMILQHYLAGIQFALGDLPADATPSARSKR